MLAPGLKLSLSKRRISRDSSLLFRRTGKRKLEIPVCSTLGLSDLQKRSLWLTGRPLEFVANLRPISRTQSIPSCKKAGGPKSVPFVENILSRARVLRRIAHTSAMWRGRTKHLWIILGKKGGLNALRVRKGRWDDLQTRKSLAVSHQRSLKQSDRTT